MTWKKVKLREVISHRKGFIEIDDETVYKLVTVKLHRKGVFLRENLQGFQIRTKKQQVCKAGDFIVAEMDAKVGGYGFIPDYLDGAIVSSHYFLFEVDEEKLRPQYLEVVSQLKILQEQIKAVGSTNYAAIRPYNVLDWEIPLPPVEKQIEIENLYLVAKEKVDNLNSEFETQLTLLSNLNQAILQEAVQGKLVPQDPNDEPASELLERIKMIRLGFQPDPTNNIGLKPTDSAINRAGFKPRPIKPRPIKELPPIQPEEIPFEIPENWVWCRLGEICEINPRNKIDDNLDAGFIPMPMVSQLFGIKPTYEIRKWGSIKKGFTHFANNDVVVAKITPCFENSKAGIISDLPNGIGAGTTELNVLRGNKFVLPEYIYAFVKRIDFLKNGERIMKGVAGQQRVPTEYFYNTPIPLPPLSEQKRIVAEIEKQFALTQQLKEKVLANQQATEQLLKALLHQAFEVQEIVEARS